MIVGIVVAQLIIGQPPLPPNPKGVPQCVDIIDRRADHDCWDASVGPFGLNTTVRAWEKGLRDRGQDVRGDMLNGR